MHVRHQLCKGSHFFWRVRHPLACNVLRRGPLRINGSRMPQTSTASNTTLHERGTQHRPTQAARFACAANRLNNNTTQTKQTPDKVSEPPTSCCRSSQPFCTWNTAASDQGHPASNTRGPETLDAPCMCANRRVMHSLPGPSCLPAVAGAVNVGLNPSQTPPPWASGATVPQAPRRRPPCLMWPMWSLASRRPAPAAATVMEAAACALRSR